jgi:hypothetical protein
LLDSGIWENRQATGSIERIVTPGYYLQAAGEAHQLAQVGEGGIALVVRFTPSGQPDPIPGVGLGVATPTVLISSTPIPDARFDLSIAASGTQAVPTRSGAEITPLPKDVGDDIVTPGEPNPRGVMFSLFVCGGALVLFALVAVISLFRRRQSS